MQFLTTEISLLMVFVVGTIRAELNPVGENVCLLTETYRETIEIEVSKPIKEKKKKWCFKIIPYTCYKTVNRILNVKEPRVVERTKIVPKCCSGYEERMTKCLPVCLKGCKNGKCAAPNVCACAPGFYGRECEKECPKNFWGENCANKCDCSDNGKCHKIFGRCDCEPGWRGKRCELPCQKGYYGHYCNEKCNCDDHLCNHKTGECTTTTAIVDYTLPSIQSEAITTKIETKTVTEICEQTEMSSSTSAAEVAISTFRTSKTNAVSEENLLEDLSTKESEITSEEMFLHTTETIAGRSTAAKFQEEVGERESEKKLISFEAMGFSTKTEVRENVSKLENNTEQRPLSETYATSNSMEETADWMSFTDGGRDADINETNNYIGERKENSDSQRTVAIFHFLPSFSVISSVSILIVIIASKWVISTYWKKDKKAEKRTVRKEKFCQQEEQIKFQTENFFWVNNCTKNSVCLTDVDLNSTAPILETFKPLNSGNSFI